MIQKDNQVLEIIFDIKWSASERIGAVMEGIQTARESKGVRCITITGEGDCFLNGDVHEDLKTAYETEFKKNPIPVILAVNGACGGIGLNLLKKADLAVASKLAVIEGYPDIDTAAEAYAVNEITSAETLAEVLKTYVDKLIVIPEELITYGHKIYFAMEQLEDKASRREYGNSVIDEIMSIQARLNRNMDLHSGVLPDETIIYKNKYDKDHAILFEIRDHVEYIQLNAPRYRNMFDWRSSMELAGAYAVANAIPDLKAIVVTGVGKRFHLGGIRHEQDDEYEQERFAEQLRIRNKIMGDIKVPLISAVNGECSGGGMSLVLKSDMVIAAESAAFGYPEVKHNSFACNSMVNTMDVIPKKAALKCFYYGELFSAAEAKKMGIVQMVVPDQELDRTMQTITEKIDIGKRI